MKTFGRYRCEFCRKDVSNAGFAQYSHLKGHYQRTLGKPDKYLFSDEMTRALYQHKQSGGEVQ